MGNPRLAESLKQLRSQVNARWPNRDKASDGWIGDAAHAANDSDHNPWVRDIHGTGVVTAIDIDADLAPGVNVKVLVDALVASRDKRIKYIIFNRQIISCYPAHGFAAWQWRKYSGKNAHVQHAHVSVNSDPGHYDSMVEWNIGKATPKVIVGEQPAELFVPVPEAPQPQPPIEPPAPVAVPQITAETEPDKEVSGIKASTGAAVTFITTTLGGAWAFLNDKSPQIIIGLAVFGAVFVAVRFWYANREKERQSRERQERERQAHELQILTLKAAMDKNLNAVTIVPQPMKNSEAS